MTYDEVLEEAMKLNVDEQKALVKAVRFDYSRAERIKVQTRECKEYIADYSEKMGKAMGIEPEKIFTKSRCRNVVFIRWVIWNNLWHKGYSTTIIGGSCGYDHAIILRGTKNVDDVRRNPAYDPELSEYVRKFDEVIK